MTKTFTKRSFMNNMCMGCIGEALSLPGPGNVRTFKIPITPKVIDEYMNIFVAIFCIELLQYINTLTANRVIFIGYTDYLFTPACRPCFAEAASHRRSRQRTMSYLPVSKIINFSKTKTLDFIQCFFLAPRTSSYWLFGTITIRHVFCLTISRHNI